MIYLNMQKENGKGKKIRGKVNRAKNLKESGETLNSRKNITVSKSSPSYATIYEIEFVIILAQ